MEDDVVGGAGDAVLEGDAVGGKGDAGLVLLAVGAEGGDAVGGDGADFAGLGDAVGVGVAPEGEAVEFVAGEIESDACVSD